MMCSAGIVLRLALTAVSATVGICAAHAGGECRLKAVNYGRDGITPEEFKASCRRQVKAAWEKSRPSAWRIDAGGYEGTNRVRIVTDAYWYFHGPIRRLDPIAPIHCGERLCEGGDVDRAAAWDRLPPDIIVDVSAGEKLFERLSWYSRRGFRTRVVCDKAEAALVEAAESICGCIGVSVAGKTLEGFRPFDPARLRDKGVKTLHELKPTARNPRNSEGDFIRLADGSILFAYSRFSADGAKDDPHAWDNGAADIAAIVSRDGGRTWSVPRVIIRRNGAMNLMSVSFLRLNDGRIALFHSRKENRLSCRKMMAVSADEGVTWGEARPIQPDSQRGWYIMNNARVIRLRTGRIIAPVAHHGFAENGRIRNEASLFCLYSDDDAATWQSGGKIDIADASGVRVVTQEPGVVELADGGVMMWTRTDRGAQWKTVSRDGGLTWGETGPTALQGPLSPALVKRHADGGLFAVWNDHSDRPELRAQGRRTPLTFARSYDEGRTWTGLRVLEGRPDDFLCYVASLEVDGALLLAYCTKTFRNLDTIRIVRFTVDGDVPCRENR